MYLRKSRKIKISCVLHNKVVQNTASVLIKASIFKKSVEDTSWEHWGGLKKVYCVVAINYFYV
jgi:hypothetical protein